MYILEGESPSYSIRNKGDTVVRHGQKVFINVRSPHQWVIFEANKCVTTFSYLCRVESNINDHRSLKNKYEGLIKTAFHVLTEL